MTPRTLFAVILKILGIFFIRDFLAILSQLLSAILYLTKPDMITESLWIVMFSLLILGAYGFVSYFLIFRSGFIIDKLKLDKGFDQETIPLNIHRSTILSISIIVIGGYLVVDEIPNFCRQLFSYFQEKRLTYALTNPSIAYPVVSVVKIITGVLMMIYQKTIVSFIERQRKK